MREKDIMEISADLGFAGFFKSLGKPQNEDWAWSMDIEEELDHSGETENQGEGKRMEYLRKRQHCTLQHLVAGPTYFVCNTYSKVL